jgi:nitrilase
VHAPPVAEIRHALWINPGDSVVIAPGGDIVAGPLHRQTGLLYADIDPGAVAPVHRTLDVAGHYGRNDVFHLSVDRTPLPPIDWIDKP